MPDDHVNAPPGDGDDPIVRLAKDSQVERFPRTGSPDDAEPDTYTSLGNVQRWMQCKKITNGQLARMIGVSAGTVSDVLRGKYAGDTGEILRQAEAAISEWYNCRSAPAGPRFVMIRIARELFTVVKATSKHRGIGVVTGPSGCGKTLAQTAVRRLDFPSAVAVEVNPGCASPRSFLRAMIQAERAASAGITGRRGRRACAEHVYSTAEAFNRIVDRLAGSGRLILIDEADNLRNSTFNVIRQLHDATGCPVVLVGRPPLHAKISRTMRDESIGGSLVGRICVEHQLRPKATGDSGDEWLFTVDEVVAMLDQYKLRYTPDAARWLCILANVSAVDGQREGGALRYAVKVLEMAMTLNQGEQLTVPMLRQANMLLRGREWGAIADQLTAEVMRQTKAVS